MSTQSHHLPGVHSLPMHAKIAWPTVKALVIATSKLDPSIVVPTNLAAEQERSSACGQLCTKVALSHRSSML